MLRGPTNHPDAEIVALAALGWLVVDPARADRLLALTGLDPTTLRARAGERALLAAILEFIQAHEPDLLACADATGFPADAITAAARELAR